jgi:hypothetical protein
MVLRKFDFKLAIKPEDVGIYTGMIFYAEHLYLLFLCPFCSRPDVYVLRV